MTLSISLINLFPSFPILNPNQATGSNVINVGRSNERKIFEIKVRESSKINIPNIPDTVSPLSTDPPLKKILISSRDCTK